MGVSLLPVALPGPASVLLSFRVWVRRKSRPGGPQRCVPQAQQDEGGEGAPSLMEGGWTWQGQATTCSPRITMG